MAQALWIQNTGMIWVICSFKTFRIFKIRNLANEATKGLFHYTTFQALLILLDGPFNMQPDSSCLMQLEYSTQICTTAVNPDKNGYKYCYFAESAIEKNS